MRRSIPSFTFEIASAVLVAACSSNSPPGAHDHLRDASQDATNDVAVSRPDGQSNEDAALDANRADGALPVPVITGPVTGGEHGLPFNSMPTGLAAQSGYTEEEYFVAGTARSFAPAGTWGTDGMWATAPDRDASYETRIIVRRPTDASRFSGTVFVEWLNVSAGADSDPDFGQGHVEILRNGDAYVGLSAQAVGIVGGPSLIQIPGVQIQALKQWDPERYAPLHHPGDDFSYDMFAQIGAALRKPNGVDPLGGLTPAHVVALGESQSAMRMVTFVNAIYPLTRTFDGFFIHSRGNSGTPLSTATASILPASTSIRADLSVPVFQFETETDLFFLGFHSARQADTDHLRTWEVAGTSHADETSIGYGGDSGKRTDPDASLDLAATCGNINSGPQTYVVRKALAALRTWVGGGTAPSAGDPIQIADAGGKIARDEHGNALGGVRTPAVDAPIAALSGDADLSKGIICALFGSTVPFDAATLSMLYPTHQDYVDAFKTAGDRAVAAGHLVAADEDELVTGAMAAPIPN